MSTQLSLPYNGEPPSVSHSQTSQEAAAAIKPHLGRLQKLVLHTIRSYPVTDEQLMHILRLSPNTLRPRRRELQLKGLIVDSGAQRLTNSGRKAVVWKAVDGK
jgi:hypothetical protein